MKNSSLTSESHKFLRSEKIEILHLIFLSFFKERNITPVALVTTSASPKVLEYLSTAPFKIETVVIPENKYGSVTSDSVVSLLEEHKGKVCCAYLSPFNIWNGSINNLVQITPKVHEFNVPVIVDIPEQTPWFIISDPDLYDILWCPTSKFWHVRTQLVEDFRLIEYGPELILSLHSEIPPVKQTSERSSGTSLQLTPAMTQLLKKFAKLDGAFEYYGYDPTTHKEYIIGIGHVLLKAKLPVPKKMEPFKIEVGSQVFLHLPLTQKNYTAAKALQK